MLSGKRYIAPMETISNSRPSAAPPPSPRPWDARLARWLVTPLKDTRVTPNHLTTLRLLLGVVCAVAFAQGGYAAANIGAVLLVLSNFVDHTDGELARISGKSSRFGHFYDLACDALVTVALFVGIGAGVARDATADAFALSPVALGWIAGIAVALIFFLRMRIEEQAGKAGTRQASFAGFETEDILYLMPLVTLAGGTAVFLVAASIGAPLFALWVIVDYRRVMRKAAATHTASAKPTQTPAAPLAPLAPAARGDLNGVVEAALPPVDSAGLDRTFREQGAFLFLDQFLPPDITEQLVASTRAVEGQLNRNYLPGHKQGGSVSRHTIDEMAPFIAELYRSPALIGWLERLCGDKLLPSPDDDPHAYALYFYTRPGDHIGWHYDTSYYKGRRYTLLLGVIDRSSCKLEYRLHTRERGVPHVDGAVQIPPGGLVFFDGDKLHHRITPLGTDEERVSLTFEYVTDLRMHPWQRFISNMKDAVAYFGFRQVFRQALRGRTKRS